MESSKAHTYHCLCSQHILSSSVPITQYAKRLGESLDKAFIVPILSHPDQEDEELNLNPASNDQVEAGQAEPSSTNAAGGVALLYHTSLNEKPTIIRREDGFEKRYLQRCERCRLVVGYQLDKAQFNGSKSFGRRADVLYVLPGGLMSTEEMASGKDMAGAIGFGGKTSISSKG